MPRVVHFEIYTDDPEGVRPFTRAFSVGSSRSLKAARSSTGLSRRAMIRSRESTAASPDLGKVKAPGR